MAEPTGFDEANCNFGPPKGVSEKDCMTIRACRSEVDGRKTVTTCWKVNADEVAEIMRTGRIWFTSWGTLTPHRVDGIKPNWVK